MKYAIVIGIFGLFFASVASAHVVVIPKTAGVGEFQTFTISVPVEKSVATIGLKVVMPEGLKNITPTVKNGWTSNIVKTGVGDTEKIEALEWYNGSIPAGYREEFSFSAQVPSEKTNLMWKAYQTYRDGTVVSWDIDPKEQPKDASGKDDFSKSGPYSTTEIIDDLATPIKTRTSPLVYSSILLSFVAIIIAAVRKPKIV